MSERPTTKGGARRQAAKLGHDMGPFRQWSPGKTFKSNCKTCKRPVYVHKRQVHGLALEQRCGDPYE